jgi:hypothetical protein
MRIYLICCVTTTSRDSLEGLWWNNHEGYVDISQATIFTHEEVERVNLPIEGEWVEFEATGK